MAEWEWEFIGAFTFHRIDDGLRGLQLPLSGNALTQRRIRQLNEYLNALTTQYDGTLFQASKTNNGMARHTDGDNGNKEVKLVKENNDYFIIPYSTFNVLVERGVLTDINGARGKRRNRSRRSRRSKRSKRLRRGSRRRRHF